MSFRFFALPAHRLAEKFSGQTEDWLEPDLGGRVLLEQALEGAEYRDSRAKDRVRSLVSGDATSELSSPGGGWGAAAIFALPPNDLPALLRLADQLDTLAHQEEGERALVWKCQKCGTRYAVPVALVRPVSIVCERCATPVELSAPNSLGEEALMDSQQELFNHHRRRLAVFFREAMARGWPVLVSAKSDGT